MNSSTRKSILCLYLASLLLAGCATISTDGQVVKKTMYTDLDRSELSRTQYYEHLGQNYFFQKKYVPSIEMFRLSLLHDAKNLTARFALAQSYVQNEQLHLGINELEIYFSSHPDFKGVSDQDMQLAASIYEKSGSFEKLIDYLTAYSEKSDSTWALWKIYESELYLKNYSKSLIQLDAIEHKNGDLYKIYLAKSEVYQAQQKWPQVLENLTLAEKIKPLDELALRQKILALYEMKNWNHLNLVAEKYHKYHPYNLDVSEKWSHAALQTGSYDIALAELKKQKKLFPDSVGLEFKIAHILFLMKDYRTATEAYDDLYALTKSDQSVFFLAQIHMLSGRFNEASEKMQLLVSTSEYYATAQIQLSRLEWKNDQKDLALNRMRSAHLLRPDSLELYQEYAQYLIWSKNYVESIALIEKANLFHPKNDQLKLLAAYCHYKLGNHRKFQQDIKAAMQINPTNSEIYVVLSDLWYEKRKPASEIQFLTEKALALNTQNKNIKPLLAWALLQQDQLAQAVALFEDFYDQNPNEIFYAEALAEIYARNALPQKTLNYQRQVAELKIQNQLKNEIDYFSKQNQIQKTDAHNNKTRLPASLGQ